jgi:hypothetical protein
MTKAVTLGSEAISRSLVTVTGPTACSPVTRKASRPSMVSFSRPVSFSP